MAADTRERRQVSVLFSDLTGFTKMSESLDPEDVADTVDALFRRFRPLIEREGGTIDKFIGDAVMAVFGAPVAHVDDPVRAVRAGLAMQRELAAFNAERGLDLRMRVGIATGDILWGSVAGTRESAMGDAVNVAQRMESTAAPGTVRVARSTERAARGRFAFVAEGAVTARGREEPVEAFVVGDESAAAQATEVPMVGRDAEIARLAQALEGGQGGYFVLTGEAGTGKSRLAAELRRRAASVAGMWVAGGRALEGVKLPLVAFGDVALGPGADARRLPAILAQAMEAAVPDATERENIAHLIVLSLGGSVPGARVANLDPARLAEEMRQAWARWIAARSPALVVIEDLHWADEATVTLLETLATALRGRATTLVASARPGARLPAGYEEIRLGELHGDAVSTLAASILGAPPAPELLAFLSEKTGGHPYYLEELARFLRDERLVEGSPARLTSAPGQVPDSLHALLTSRLDALPADARAVLKGASVVGRTFWLRLLERLVERESAEAVELARRRDIVASQDGSLLPGDPQFAFRHALLKDAAYALLTRKERARLHGIAADLLEARAAEGGRRVRALAARHREAAGQPAEAGARWLAAAREAVDAMSSAEALEYAREASRLAPGPEASLLAARALHWLSRNAEAVSEAERAESAGGEPGLNARLLKARALFALGKFEAVIACSREVAGASTGVRRARALIQESQALRLVGKLAPSLERALEALAVLDAPLDGSPAELDGVRVEALLTEARSRRSTGDFVPAEVAARRALEIADARGDNAGRSAAWGVLGDLARTQGRAQESLEWYGRVLPVRVAMGDRRGAATCRTTMGSACNALQRLDEAIRHYSEALPVLRETGDRYNAGWCLHGLALSTGKTDPAAAAAFLDEAVQEFRESGSPAGVASVSITAAQIRFRLGQYESALRLADEACRVFRGTGDNISLPVALSTLATCLCAAGDLDGAERALLEALELPGADRDPRNSLRAHEDLSLILETRGDLAGALRETHAACAVPATGVPSTTLAASLGRLASLQALSGDAAGARASLRSRGALPGMSPVDTNSFHHAHVLLTSGDPQAAERTFAALPPLAPNARAADRVDYLLFRAYLHSDLGRPAESRHDALSALGDGHHPTRGQTLEALLVAAEAELECGRAEEALRLARESAGIAKGMVARTKEGEARAVAARALAFAGRAAECEDESRDAILLSEGAPEAEVMARASAVAAGGPLEDRLRDLEASLSRPSVCARAAARASLKAADVLRRTSHPAEATSVLEAGARRAREAGATWWAERLAMSADRPRQ